MKRFYTFFAALAFLLLTGRLSAQSQDTATWTFNPNDYSSTMIITAVIDIEGVESRDPDDIVAAFIGTECRGKSRPVFVPNLNRYIVSLLVYGNAETLPVTFQVFDKGTGRVLPVTDTVPFAEAPPLGSFANPFVLHTVRLDITFEKDDVLCSLDDYGFAEAKVKGGMQPYKYKWSTEATTPRASRLRAGTYRLTVTDANGFEKVDSVDIVNEMVDIAEPVLTAAPDTLVCAGTDVFLFANVPPQGEPLLYTWYDINDRPISTKNFVGIPAIDRASRVYAQVTVRNCPSERVPVTVNVRPQPTAVFLAPSRVAKVGQEVVFIPLENKIPYAARWFYGDGTSDSGNVPGRHTYETPGFYDVMLEVFSLQGCYDNHTVSIRIEEESTIIIEDKDLIVLLDVEHVACEADRSGVIRAQVLEGAPPFRYAWSTGETSSTIRRLQAGRYRLTVTDSENKRVVAEANVEVENETIPTAEVLINNGQAICLGSDVPLTARADLPGASFFWYDEPAGGQLLHTGAEWLLRELSLSRTVYVETRLGACASATRVPVSVIPSGPTADFTPSVFELPLGDTLKLTAVAEPANGRRFIWDYDNGHRDTTTLAQASYVYPQAGEYRLRLTVENNNGCQAWEEVTILVLSGGLTVLFDATAPLCPDDASGILLAQALGGRPPYTYQWNTGQRSATLSGLLPGAYRVTATDAAGNQAVGTIALNSRSGPLPAPRIVVNGGEPFCAGDDILLAAFADGVSGASFYWYDGADPSRLLYAGESLIQFAIGASRRFLVETRLGGCASAQQTFVEVPVDGPDARFQATAQRATPGVEIGFDAVVIDPDNRYTWTFGDGTAAATPVTAHAYGQPGAYRVELTVTNEAGCSASTSQIIEIDEAGVMFAAFEVENTTCATNNDGAVLVSALDGTAPYTYRWSNGQTGSRLSSLPRGVYYVTITDSSGRQLVDSVEVRSQVSEVLAASAVVAGGDTVCIGRDVTLFAFSQQAEPVSYFWYDAPAGGVLRGVSNQLLLSSPTEDEVLYLEARIGQCAAPRRTPVRVTVLNPNRGFTADPATVAAGSEVQFSPVLLDDQYQYQWYFGDGGVSRQARPVHVYETEGVYDVQLIVVSPLGCVGLHTRDEYLTVVSGTDFTATLDITQVPCAGGDTPGAITARGFNGTPPYRFQWSTGATGAEITGLPEGTYTVTVTDADGKTVVRTGEVRSIGRTPPLPEITLNSDGPLCTGRRVSLTASAGTGVDQFAWYDTTGQLVYVGSVFTINELNGPETYRVEARRQGCISPQATITLDVKSPSAAFSTDPATAIIIGEPVRFMPADTSLAGYRWTFGDGTTSNVKRPNYTYTQEGVYDVSLTVTDSDGCVQTNNLRGVITVLGRNTVAVKSQVFPVLCDRDRTGEIVLQGVGGVPPYSYQWADGSTAERRTDLPAGMYNFTITDSRGARRIDSVRVENLNAVIPAPQVEINGNRPVCAGTPVLLLASVASFPEGSISWFAGLDSEQPNSQSRLLQLPALQRDTVLFLESNVNGCRSERRSLTIRVQRPEAGFSVLPRRQLTAGDLAQFVPVNERADNQYYWTFGDGGWSRRVKPYYFYNVAGVFDVSLTVTDADGCANTVQLPEYVRVQDLSTPLQGGPDQLIGLSNSVRATPLQVAAWPNPFPEAFSVVLRPEHAGEYRLRLADMMGRTRWAGLLVAAPGDEDILTREVSIAGLAPGLYVLSVEGPQGITATLRLMHIE